MSIETQQLCLQVQHYLQQVSLSSTVAQPPPWLVEHAATCAQCRGAITLFVAALIAPLSLPLLGDCTTCQAELAAYIDCEMIEGTETALRSYPTVGWHLWFCPNCTELYQLTSALEIASRAGELALPFATASQVLYSIRLSPSFLSYALPRPMAALGEVRGLPTGNTVLVAEQESHHHVILSVEHRPNSTWQINVALSPPVLGWLVLQLGEHSFRARFDKYGQAVVSDIPASLLAVDDGPELIVMIEIDK